MRPARASIACVTAALAVATLAMLATAGGCNDPAYDQAVRQNIELEAQVKKARQESDDLQSRLDAQQAQVKSLIGLGDKRVELIPHAESIELGSFTGGYSTKGGKTANDAVKVYLLPRDGNGDVVKAPGSVEIRLFDLGAPEGQNLLGESKFTVQEVQKNWYSGFVMAYHYSFVCPFKKMPKNDEVTIRVVFVDYVTGKTFSATKTVNVALPQADAPK